MLFTIIAGVSMLAIPVSIIALIYALIKKKRKKPFLLAVCVCIGLTIISSFGIYAIQTPEEKAAIQQKIEEEKSAKEKEESEKKAAELEKILNDKKLAEEKAIADKKAADEKAEQEKLLAEKAAADKKAQEEKLAAEQKEAEEKSALQKKYDDQKKYEDWLAWKQKQDLIPQYTNDVINTLKESKDLWFKWSAIQAYQSSDDMQNYNDTLYVLNDGLDKYHKHLLSIKNDENIPAISGIDEAINFIELRIFIVDDFNKAVQSNNYWFGKAKFIKSKIVESDEIYEEAMKKLNVTNKNSYDDERETFNYR